MFDSWNILFPLENNYEKSYYFKYWDKMSKIDESEN